MAQPHCAMLLTLLTCLLGSSGLWSVGAQDSNEDMDVWNPYRKLASSNVNFAFRLFEHLQSKDPDKNIFFSPISISMALSMMALGASIQTGNKILEGLGFNISEIPEAEIHQHFQQLDHLLAQGDSIEKSRGHTLFFDQDLDTRDWPSEDVGRYYGLKKVPIDFQNWNRSRSQIYEYFREKTRGKIAALVQMLKDPARLNLINYNFFIGLWKQPFDPENTKDKYFFASDNNIVKVPMMYQTNIFNFLHDPILGCTVLQLDYVDNRTAFLILHFRGDIHSIIERLDQDTLYRWSRSIVTSRAEVTLPKFTLSGTYDLGEIMKDLNITDLEEEQTDLSGITGNAKQKLSKVLHEAKLELIEYGWEHATPINDNLYRKHRSADIRFNRPFLIMVCDRVSWNILFLGKVVKPE